MKPNIGLKDKHLQAECDLLNRLLSDEYVLYTKTRNFHWNVTGLDFGQLHALFEKQYEELNGIVDEVAERVRQLGGESLGSLKEFLKETRLKEHAGVRTPAAKMIALLLEDHEAVASILREDLHACAEQYGDMGTSDFLTGLLEQHEKMAWMLRAHLE